MKATVDAYDGTVHFYVVDPTDPIIQTYRKAFPELFEDIDRCRPDLRAHLRYPEDIFSAQTEQYALYHITDPVQYFNKQAIWDVAPSPDASSAAPVASAVANGNNGGRNTTLAPRREPDRSAVPHDGVTARRRTRRNRRRSSSCSSDRSRRA